MLMAKIRFILISLLLTLSLSAVAEGGGKHCHDVDEVFNAGETMMHHVLDSHDWHLLDWPLGESNGQRCYQSIQLNLPWILYSKEHGFSFYGNTHSLEEAGMYEAHHGKAYLKGHGPAHEEHAAEHHDDQHGDHAQAAAHEVHKATDLSPTKTVVQIFLVLLLMAWLFIKIGKSYVVNKGKAPSGAQSLFEPVILFVRDNVVQPYMGEKTQKFLPYMLMLFFFIWFSNLFGMMPFNSNIMGNISITFTLALFTFIMVNVYSTKDYWRHMLAMPGVPKPILLLLTPIEIFGMFIKPIALMIRLFANIAAGHFMILALISLIFIMGENGRNMAGAFGIMPLSIVFTIGIFLLEVIVGAVQAYVFTMLTAVFIGQAMEKHDDH